MSLSSQKDKIRYWVVSPNVNDDEPSVPDWRAASVVGHAAFMGYGPEDLSHSRSGYKFAHEVKSGDRVIIARRHDKEPEIVGLGIVRGRFQRSLPGTRLTRKPGSVRKLSPFQACSRAVPGVPLMSALKHTKALAELHPEEKKAHKQVCDWLERELKRRTKTKIPTKGSGGGKGKGGGKGNKSKGVRAAGPPGSFREDYTVRTHAQVKTAKRREAKLVQQYIEWLRRQGRPLSTILYGKLRCDAYEHARRNLIEAKSSSSREHLRMAVGQLSDYAYQGRKKYGDPNKAILVPTKPLKQAIDWLETLDVAVIWPKKREFLDSANGQFT